MLQTLYQIGKVIKDDKEYENYFQAWGNPFPGREKEAKVIVVEVEDGKFKKITIEDFRLDYISKYLYKTGSTKGRATNSVPTVPFVDLEKSFKKVENSFKNFGHDFVSKEVLAKIKTALSELDLTNLSYLLTFKINGSYLGEHPDLVELFEENAFKGFAEKNYSGIKKSSAENYVCALSGKKTNVYGFVDSLGFTVNDNAYMRNGFDQSYSYKMFPVSQEAAKIIHGAKTLVFTNEFSNHFSGKIKYLILPKFITEQKHSTIKEIFELFRNKQALNINTEKKGKGTGGFLKETEGIINEITEEEKLNQEDILYDLLFYEDKQAQLSLLLQLTDVRPSRIRSIMLSKKWVEDFYDTLTNFDDGRKQYIFSINLVAIKNFLLTEQGRNKVPHPFFFKITEAIFYGQKIDREIFMRFLLLRFRKAFKELHVNTYGLGTAVKEGFVLLQFLEQLDIFRYKSNSNNMEQIDKQVKLDAMGFITQHPDFFDTNYKKGAFLFGCLVTRLMYNQPGNAFLKELNDLNIDKKLLEKKFSKLIAKLRQYGHEFRDLEQAAAHYMTDQSKVSKDEISFAVTMGLILQKEFDIRNKKVKEVETELGVKHEIVES